MSSDPPFDHPSDHTKYGSPPELPRVVPWYLTPGFKIGCSSLLLGLLLMCCFSWVIQAAKQEIVNSINSVGAKLDETNKKLDELNKKLDDGHPKPGEPKKDDGNKKEK